MSFDLEDVFGDALADVIRRVLCFLSCVLGAAFCTSIGSVLFVMIEESDFEFEYVLDAVTSFWILLLQPVFSGWLILYLPCLIAAGAYFTKSDEPKVLWWGIIFVLLSALMILPFLSYDRYHLACAMAFLFDVGIAGAIYWLGRLWESKKQAKAHQHLMGITTENEMRRQSLRDELGTDVADRDYAVDEEPHQDPRGDG